MRVLRLRVRGRREEHGRLRDGDELVKQPGDLVRVQRLEQVNERGRVRDRERHDGEVEHRARDAACAPHGGLADVLGLGEREPLGAVRSEDEVVRGHEGDLAPACGGIDVPGPILVDGVRDREIPNGENVCGVGGGEHALRLHPSMVCDDHIDLVGKAIMVAHGGRVNRCVLHEIPHPT